MLHKGRTTATVLGAVGAHGTLQYQYEVDGHTYRGWGDPGNPPYPPGSTFEVQYSTAHPSFSVADGPFTIFGQFLVGCLFLIWVDYLATRYGRAKV